jgi:hypothetical protein
MKQILICHLQDLTLKEIDDLLLAPEDDDTGRRRGRQAHLGSP